MSGNQHELFMMAITAVVSIIVAFLAGRIWEAWKGFDEDGQISRDEIALINAERHRCEREEPALRKMPARVRETPDPPFVPKPRRANAS